MQFQQSFEGLALQVCFAQNAPASVGVTAGEKNTQIKSMEAYARTNLREISQGLVGIMIRNLVKGEVSKEI